MQLIFIKGIIILICLMSCVSKNPSINMIGKLNVEQDLFLAQFDCKTDVDDLHSIAGVATILADSRFANVNYHAVAGAYGIQEGLYVPANELFEAAFGSNWSDAHTNFDKAVKEVSSLIIKTLDVGGNIWIAEAGQSDFTAAVIKNIIEIKPSIQTTKRINVVQHSDWNENSAAIENLNFVKENCTYIKIPDGNATGNGSPGLKTSEAVNIHNYITNQKLLNIWEMALSIANKYNGKENRYNNSAIANGGFDFSDVSETCWIFGYESILDTEQFFKEFNSSTKM